MVFTDRICAEEEQEKIHPQATTQTVIRSHLGHRAAIALPPSCNKTPDDLLYGVRSAIDMQDVNQLAKHYHWPGVSDAKVEQLLSRLETLVNSPLINIQLLYAVEPEINQTTIDLLDNIESVDTKQDTSDAYQPTRTRQEPYALKISQFQSNNNTQTQTSTFRLQRHFDCWWIRY